MSSRRSEQALSRRGFLQLAVGVTASSALAACIPAGTGQPATGGAGPAAENVALRYTTVGWGGFLSEPWMQVVQQFNDSQSRVQVAYEDIAEGYEKVMAQAAGAVGADTYCFETKQLYSFASRNFFAPLDDFVAKSSLVKEDAYFADDWKEMFWNGKMYLAPFDNSPAMLWYNVDLFDEAGVAHPPTTFDDPNWTWETFLDTAQKLSKGEGAERLFGWVGERGWTYQLNWIWSNGGWLLNESKTECVIDMPETIEALQWSADLILQHKVWPMADQVIQGGNSAMFFGRRGAIAQKGTWWAIDLKAQEGLNWNVAPQPMGKAGTFVRNPLDAWGIWSGTKHPQESWEFLEFISQPDPLAVLVQAGLSVSRKEVLLSDVFLKQKPEQVNWQLFIDALDGHVKPHPDTAIYPEMNDLLRPAWDAVMDGTSTAEQMAQQVKDPINQLLKDCIAKGNCVGA
ncbi:MAG: extracellular solute-binding protein [Caldilinea sp. CFX5]|nr:extracellular solute-binding protein [Caldilinea sp. CFX5]